MLNSENLTYIVYTIRIYYICYFLRLASYHLI
nr:MAG TPA: hypothetical protein [Caudoviricetes sp.]